MRPFLAALLLCWVMASSVMLAFPLGSTDHPAPMRIVYLCCMPEKAKDQSRLPQEETPFGALVLKPKPVTPIRYVAADYPPAVQAAENRKKRTAKR